MLGFQKANQTAVKTLIVYLMFGLFNYAFAAGGGLNAFNSEATSWKTWGYSVLGIICMIYLMYNVVMAMWDKKQWSDVVMALVYTAAAGGILVAGAYMWAIWGSGNN
ncbi:hypothetical protein YA0783_25070 [Pseudomonas corrugata]|uniref:hypothetical protein n=1 Tax=Pseudomonas corrugata TaxID=47879 RepID=UPI0018E64204|nr:hypothetical protein [Pseudomonas corrugata]MBI6621563.1 hypothetical protein [Pseudomonas corrugata]MBI6694202.1 hypothetical protein [Pseudomonas corrugata]